MHSLKKSVIFSKNSFIHSVNAALEGVVHALKSERNMRLHFFIGLVVLAAGIYFDFTAIEFMLLSFAVSFVLVSEMFNTVVEKSLDFISKDYHPVAKVIKDISAGAVFVSAVNACIVGYLLLFKRVNWSIGESFHLIKQSSWHITLIVLLFVIGFVIFIKVMRGEKVLLKGGMPSGHSAFAFSVWVVISLMTENALVSFLVFFMAVLIARSRRINGIHTAGQVVAGSILGAVISLLVFQLLS